MKTLIKNIATLAIIAGAILIIVYYPAIMAIKGL